MIVDGLKLDETDIRIISLTQKEPHITHSRIAEVINKTQPTVGNRIKKLDKSGVLQLQSGVNFKKVNINLIIVNLRVKNPETFMEMTNFFMSISNFSYSLLLVNVISVIFFISKANSALNCFTISSEYSAMMFDRNSSGEQCSILK